METINHTQLAAILKNSRGAQPVGIEAVTDAKARKTGNPFGVILKHSRSVGFIGADYESSVNREAGRQGGNPDFQAESLPWGQWSIPGKVIEHKGQLYLRAQTTPGQRKRQAARVLAYMTTNGEKLTREQVAPYLPEKRESNKQQEETGITETIQPRTYAFASIRRLRIGGKTYLIK